jgi:hypothetical protein
MWNVEHASWLVFVQKGERGMATRLSVICGQAVKEMDMNKQGRLPESQ